MQKHHLENVLYVGAMAQRSHNKKILGFNLVLCVVSPVCMGFHQLLWFPPTILPETCEAPKVSLAQRCGVLSHSSSGLTLQSVLAICNDHKVPSALVLLDVIII